MKKILPICFASVALFVQASFGQNATTTPVGAMTVTVKAGNATTPTTQLIGFGLSNSPVFQANLLSSAVVSGPGGNVTKLNFTPGSLTGQLGLAGGTGTHYVELIGGSNDGMISHVASSTSDDVTLSDLISPLTGAVTVRIRAFRTVQEVFGSTNSAGFLGGASSATADIIRILLSGTPAVEVFYNTSTGAWQTSTGSAANSLPIPADAGLEIVRRGTNQFTFILTGEVKTGATALVVEGGSGDVSGYYQNIYPLPTVRLKDLGLYTGNATTGMKEGTSATNADVLTIEDKTTGLRNQFFVDSVSKRWKSGFTDASLIQIPENASILITRRNGGTFTWSSPQPSMNIGDTPPQLSLAAAASRKTHGSAGVWDVNLPLTGTSVGVEPRTGGGSNNHSIVFTFDGASSTNPLVAGNASITSGSGSIASTQLNGNELIVNLTGVTNQQTLTVAINNVAAQNGQTFAAGQASMGVLFGDVNYTKIINVTDISLTKSVSLAGLTFQNFRTDVNVTGQINVTDVSIVKSRSLQSLP